MTPTPRRRFLVTAGGVLAAAASPPLAAALTATPRQPVGPFYPVELPLDDDNDLTRVAGVDAPARGHHAELTGRLLDGNGRPLGGLRMEIWQCDANGRYHHPRDGGDGRRDAGFQGFGHTMTDGDGRYRFRTIRPVPYPGRTPHIHIAVRPLGERPFVTQLYVAGEERNDGDFLYRRVPAEKRELVTAAFRPAGDGELLQARWDVVLGQTPA
ncbi:MAG: protocatechuate 3,4-dioxygenase [Gammaproteobacteria bacterium]|nr:protocatechuate 3,4-dioxygenase [Gammaproteobacteria bacterium]